ncbi:MAG: DUF3419 family protein [Clostridiales bacterium]|nr:DUF3419 family protein [Clostridiales bacterium]
MNQPNYYEDIEYDYLTDKVLYYASAKRNDYDNNTTERCYPTTNEHLDSFINKYYFDLTGKRVATVGSSGDQALVALQNGAKDVTIIDANAYSRAFIEYKIAMIKNFDYDTTTELLLDIGGLFHWSVYRKISHDLSEPTRQFWDKIILEQAGEHVSWCDNGFDDMDIERNMLHSHSTKKISIYQNEANYNKLRNILKSGDFELNFITADVYEFPDELQGKFDMILLSNIIDYVDIETFGYTVDRLYDNNLNPGGKIQVHYELVYPWESYKSIFADLETIEVPVDPKGTRCILVNKPMGETEPRFSWTSSCM